MKRFFIICFAFSISLFVMSSERSLKITKRYLNFPVSHKVDRAKMTLESKENSKFSFVIRLASDDVDYWVFKDMSDYYGQKVTLSYDCDMSVLNRIYESDEPAGAENMYKEPKRPQFHFTSRRGWINDPNGLIYYDGEYHLFYQHNPYENEWQNMHWGHAVSHDLIHWEELPDALYPDTLGLMFSGSAVIDYGNTSGFGSKNNPAMVLAYTSASSTHQVQCIAYSLDHGRTFIKYDKNPVISSNKKWQSIDTRDPKVFWYAPNRNWVMVLNERDGHSIYNSVDLKNWTYQSHITGFWECPELFELPVDGDSLNTKWVMYDSSGTYMLGSFDGKIFTPESGKHFYTTGSIYAAQTFSNIPKSDGRRIQIGFGRISQPDTPFNNLMMLPTELELHKTINGIRLYSKPVREVETLCKQIAKWSDISSTEADNYLKKFNESDCIRIRTTFKLSHSTTAGLKLFGQDIIDYRIKGCTLNGRYYSPEDPTSMEISADIYIDKTSIEVFIDDGLYSYSMKRQPDKNNKEGFHFFGKSIEIKNLEVFSVDSIW